MKRYQILVWRVMLILATIYLAVALPLQAVMPEALPNWMWTALLFTSLVYFADLIFYLRSVHSRGKRYFRAYLQNWLIIDAISVVPFALLTVNPFLQFLQLVKVIHVGMMVNAAIRRSPRYAALMRLSHFAYILLIVLHWVACGWLALRQYTDEAIGTAYIKSLYWATTTIATVGYGDITPKSTNEMLYAIFVMLIGVLMYGYLIGNIASLLNRIDPMRVEHQENLEKVHSFIRYRNLPHNLAQRINDYYAYLWDQRLGYNETTILASLPPGLKTDVSLFLKRDVIEHVNIFREASEEFVREISMNIHPQILMPGDYVFKAGDSARSMYFISRGSVEVISSEGRVLSILSEGDFFGEMALIHKRKRNASVRARDYTDIYVLDVSTFERILADHPGFKLHIETVVQDRMN